MVGGMLVGGEMAHEWLSLAPAEGRLRARLYEKGAVVGERVEDDGGISLEVRLPRRDLEQLLGARQTAC